MSSKPFNTATIANGATENTPYVQDFTITVNAAAGNFVAVTNITGVPSTAKPKEPRIIGAVETWHAASLQIINSAGVVVHTQTITAPDVTLRLDYLPAGAYFFTIESGKESKTVKVMKN